MSSSGLPSIREQLRSVPEQPGCYLWKDAAGGQLWRILDIRESA